MADLLTGIERSQPAHLCEHCLTFAGRTTKGKPCCELRALATMPKDRRQAVYDKVKREDGPVELDTLKMKVNAEYHRRVEFNLVASKAAAEVSRAARDAALAAIHGKSRPKI